MAYTAGHVHADDFKLSVGIQYRPKDCERLPNRIQFWATRASHGYQNFFHPARASTFPELRLLVRAVPLVQKFLQRVHGFKYLIRATQHPSANLFWLK